MLLPKSVTPSLAARSTLLSDGEAVEIAHTHYGLSATARRLSGEKDSNFRITAEDGNQYLLKIVNPSEDSAVTNMHTKALQHVEKRDPEMPVQRVVLDLQGRPEFELDYGPDDRRTVRLVTFTKGELQRKTTQTPQQRRNIGAMLARLQEALVDFRHPAENHFSTWDLKNTLSLKPMIAEIKDESHSLELLNWLDRFADEVIEKIPSLRAQVVHNDLNSDNIVVDPRMTEKVVGIIDFGDMVHTPVVFDVAVAAAYQLTEAPDPLGAACEFLSGFHGRRALLAAEIELLFTTIMARMVMRIAITEWRAVRFPENREYILRNTPQAWRQFHRLAEISRARVTDEIARALAL
ncbi:phosphotransferase [Mesorhizobium caraganae]|uniref:phosphotransferase n=1 Tax=Mesorhizobium caraganae TaxID=483206 RepID=UPI00178355E6|nr:phosphotransferase [Mesorhizobium caraganae]MBM2715120.1 phosphotransferase [Mesorhizobium caraganae]